MPLIIPNSIDNDTAADAAEVQQNFATIQSYVNTNLMNRDGSVALTAPLLLTGDPTQPNHAANKGYVDTGDAATAATAAAATALKVSKAGDTMTGHLTLHDADPTANNHAARKLYVDTNFVGKTGDQTMSGALNVVGVYQSGAQTAFGNALTRKDYVDAVANDRVYRGGDTMTGLLQLAPTGDNQCLQMRAPNHATPYLSWYHGTTLGAYSQVNFSTGVWDQWLNPDWAIRWWIAGANVMSLSSDQLTVVRKINNSYAPTSGSWATANVIAQSDGGHGTRISIRNGGTVAQWRMHSAIGQMDCVNADTTGFIGVRGGAYTNASSLKIKKDVRSLREGSVTAKGRSAKRALLSADADTVEAPPDIMALRPIIYRHAVDPQCVIVDDDGEQVGVEPEPMDTVRGQEGRREHIGLIADEVQHVIPSAVAHDADGEVVGIDYAQITVALLDHVQTLTERIAALEAAK